MQVIKANTIDEAVEGILDELMDTRRKENVIYFDGWDGLGASAVLRVVAQQLARNEKKWYWGLQFEPVIHIDCSKWESTRALQKEIAEQLKLPNQVMEMFDKQDEEDDFNGITDQQTRTGITEVAIEIQRTIQGSRFLLVLHNGSNEEIDISSLGLSVYGYLTNKVIWTFQGRFRMDPNMKDKAMKKDITDVLFSASCYDKNPQDLWYYLLREEATLVAYKNGVDPAILVKCFLYMLTLNCTSRHYVNSEYDLATHACNYWICDGIIPIVTDSAEAWQVSETLLGEIRWDMDYHDNEFPSHFLRYAECVPHWNSPAYGFVLVPNGVVPSRMFQHFDKLGVIKLSRCSFSFSSPPFLCCRGLRFLWLDHCKDERTYAEQRERSWACFQSLWVLDLRYTDLDVILSAKVIDLLTQLRELNVMGAERWDMSHLRGRLRNIRKLRVTKSTCFFSNNVLLEMENLDLLDLSENRTREDMSSIYGSATTIRDDKASLSGSASNINLETVIIGRYDGLGIISFRDCKELKNLFLKESLGSLEELELSGTGVKTLNFSQVVATSLPKRIILLGCEKLRAILWPKTFEGGGWSGLLHLDTTSISASADGGEASHAHPYSDQALQQQKEEEFKGGWRICLMDTRLLRSLYPVRDFLRATSVHIDICPAATVGGRDIQGTSSNKLVQVQPHRRTMADSMYGDVLKDDGPAEVMVMWDCPKIFLYLDEPKTCMIKIIHRQGNKLLEDAPFLPDFTCKQSTSVHVYDNLSITNIPPPPDGSGWQSLRWCRVERCPKLHTVFIIRQGSGASSFRRLETLWLSQLLSAQTFTTSILTFCSLELLHLDCCPRLLHVFPLASRKSGRFFCSYLQTLEIVYCDDLREVFPLAPGRQKQDTIIEFPYLRSIHLHEVPKLQRIYGCRMWAPKLETVKIRGCWSLRRLPSVDRDTKPPKVDCEKDWWDDLQWDGLNKYHHPSLYEPSHSLYYKAELPRGTILG
uniref:Putative leucine rich repeat n=2 Tax=Hordeum vulgare subsp. vulgare TaxID=112509 RepID=A0A2R4QN03_HORVV|nr:putative leucine rich repeat [Hordeum vulgare subsp. vulgare]